MSPKPINIYNLYLEQVMLKQVGPDMICPDMICRPSMCWTPSELPGYDMPSKHRKLSEKAGLIMVHALQKILD